MAQTITTSKASTSVTFNGSSNSTILTAPSGAASRVILNGLSFYRQDGAGGYCYMTVSINNATSGRIIIGGMYQMGGGSVYAFTFWPSQTNGGLATGYSTTLTNNSFIITNNTQNNIPQADNDPSSQNGIVATSSSSWAYMPAQFWMSSGDTLQVKLNWGGATGICQSNFTIITES